MASASEELAPANDSPAPVETKVEHTPSSSDPVSAGATEEAVCKIVSPNSMDSEETEFTTLADASSVKSDGSSREQRSVMASEGSEPSSHQSDSTVSAVDGVLVDATASEPSLSAATSMDAEVAPAEADDGDAWETVGNRARDKRKKTAPSSGRSLNTGSSFNSSSAAEFRKPRAARTVVLRKKSSNRKMARDVVNSVLDSVDDEARKRQHQQHRHQLLQTTLRKTVTAAASPSEVNPWKIGPPVARANVFSEQSTASSIEPAVKKETTLRDIVLGRHKSTGRKAPENTGSPSSPAAARRNVVQCSDGMKSSDAQKEPLSPRKNARLKGHAGTAADQNTAPTYQETVSAVSTFSNLPVTSKGSPASTEDRSSKNEPSTVDTDEAPQNRARADVPQCQGYSAPAPPLPTLLSPGNANSANSSVASSLEVPHTSRRHHHHNATVDVNDVGYHLLDVCDRLSRDMSLFMSKRALALKSRRKERGALLAALQDSVASIWPGRGHVEMYGSCATQLDLPSSDLDVVIVGLDRNADLMKASTASTINRSTSMSSERISRSQSVDEVSGDEAQQAKSSAHHVSTGAYSPMNARMNAERVVRLGAELEAQAWAVQVNSIPTAYVPVIKVLADPSKLKGSSGADWLTQHQQLEAQAEGAPTDQTTSSSKGVPSSGMRLDPRQHYQPPWRGADVINGLLKLDITFDGPEHGGIGSTQFSSRVVSDACQAAGTHPDATVLVQVVMVLKEILAQRKLNEPYSGGLSSYALLLLVLGLLQERAVICEEIERAERQRKAMADGESSSSFVAPIEQNPASAWSERNPLVSEYATPKNAVNTEDNRRGTLSSKATVNSRASSDITPATDHKKRANTPWKSSGQAKNNKHAVSNAAQKPSSISSWAPIAKKKPTGSRSSKEIAESDMSTDSRTTQSQPKRPTFADAVARSGPAARYPALSSPKPFPRNGPKEAFGDSTKGNAGVNASASGKKIKDDAPENQPSGVSDSPSRGTGANSTSAPSLDNSLGGAPSLYPQGYNDVIEVLCSGETTAGKLLMHFLLFYGQHFDAQATAIDLSGKHERNVAGQHPTCSYFSPYIPRQAAGRIDPVTGMLTVDPIVVYDPLEGAENNNVARRCFAWSNVRWVFAQSYATLSSAVERSATPPTTPGAMAKSSLFAEGTGAEDAGAAAYNVESCFDLMDPSSPLLSCLLSF